jgi:hypothetical protein
MAYIHELHWACCQGAQELNNCKPKLLLLLLLLVPPLSSHRKPEPAPCGISSMFMVKASRLQHSTTMLLRLHGSAWT